MDERMERMIRKGFEVLLLGALIATALVVAAPVLGGGTMLFLGLGLAIASILVLTRTLRIWFDRERAAASRDAENLYLQLESLEYVKETIRPKVPLPAARGWAMSPDTLKLLIGLLREHKPRLVVEAGSGISTVVTAYVLKQLGRGKVVSLDHDPEFGGRTQALLKQHGLTRFGEVRIAPLHRHRIDGKVWQWYEKPAWQNLKGIGLLTIDGPIGSLAEQARWPALPLLRKQLAKQPVVLLDDGDRQDEWAIARDWQHSLPKSRLQRIHTEKGAWVISPDDGSPGITL